MTREGRVMTDTSIKVYKLCIEKNLTFVTFRLPRQTGITTYVQSSPVVHEWISIHDISDKQGFIMAPFDTRNGKKYIMVNPDIVIDGEATEEVIEQVKNLPGNDAPGWNGKDPFVIGKEQYLSQVKEIRKQISRGYFQKAVLSRIDVLKGNYIPIALNIFYEACRRHPNAFVYIFKSDDHFWLGASPEPLLRLKEGNGSTVSLAGTRPYSSENLLLNNWTIKEVLEQEYVTRYIHDILRVFQVKDYRVTSPYVKKAGDLVHLRSDFTFKYSSKQDSIWELVDSLHPTPAVAGQPKDEAISFIKSLESHDREYYTGFLGPVQSSEGFDLFVNLRCMKITPEYLSLYIGGGITLESDPEEEWDETRLKAKSLLQIIEAFSPYKDEKTALQTTHR